MADVNEPTIDGVPVEAIRDVLSGEGDRVRRGQNALRHRLSRYRPDPLRAAAIDIANYYRDCEAERGRPYPETFKHPANGQEQVNGTTIPIRLLNALRAAVPEE